MRKHILREHHSGVRVIIRLPSRLTAMAAALQQFGLAFLKTAAASPRAGSINSTPITRRGVE
jgi:hypothetical protein